MAEVFDLRDYQIRTDCVHERFAEPFGCIGSTAYGDHLFEYMWRA